MRPVPRSVASRLARRATLLVPFALVARGEGVETPRLIVQAPAELAAAAREIDAIPVASWTSLRELAGLAAFGPPVVVVLAPEGSDAARRVAPWISGYAESRRGLVVLLPRRVGRYPDRGLVPLLRHEVAHVVVARAAGGRDVPRWFDEGLAMAAARPWELGDRARVALAVLTDDRLPLARLDTAFAGGEAEAQSAYALAGDLMRELLQRHGRAAPAAILARLAGGERFAAAFRGVTGESLAEFERAYWQRRTLWDRWVPVISSSVVLWAGVALLALAAFRRRRARDAELRRSWEAEEGSETDAPP